jgi:hypothetical protein
MTSEQKVLWSVFLVIGVVLAVLLFGGGVAQKLEPRLGQAWVAIEVEGSGVAEVARVEVPAGRGFTLRAVLAAEPPLGEPFYYTEAPRLILDGREVPAASLRRWDRPEPVKVLWFTVEGNTPYLPLAAPEELERFALRDFFRVDWPTAWSVPGSLEPANDDPLEVQLVGRDQPFGTQRYHARVEVFDPANTLTPRQRSASWGAAEIPARREEFPTVVASLPGALAAPSRVFGLSQIEPLSLLEAGPLSRLEELLAQELAFTAVWALEQTCRAAGAGCESLRWRSAPWGARAWPAEAGPGDLLRVGKLAVVLYRDQGEAGVLDRADLCLAYSRGAAVRALGDLFAAGATPEIARPGGAGGPASD